MALQILLKAASVVAINIDGDHVVCPGCGSATLILYGASMMERTETQENGQSVHVELNEKSHAFEIEQIECYVCNTRWHVKTNEVALLEQRNEELRQLVIRATGQDPYFAGIKVH